MATVDSPAVTHPVPDSAKALDLLRHGELELEGRLAEASNATLRAFVTLDGITARCVYKPVRGERPLWDFPDGTLAGREVAAYLVSEATEWKCIPPTVLRDGPFGPGSCQLWIESVDPWPVTFARKLPAGWRAVAVSEEGLLGHEDTPALARIAAFDEIVNNADRKGSHLLRAVDQRIYGIDHGVCFHAENKLRTVLWGWAGIPYPIDVLEGLTRVREAINGDLSIELGAHITAGEVTALRARLDRSLVGRVYPVPGNGWPALPWPAL
ncbi:MAG: SCO1664 family protein [Longispora sp.]|nr:SCO1664 family protein [Longispora sp. (in: high G+C Gram-positive bacteria)]